MKVLLVNGSPNGHGCTYTALKEIEKTLRAEGVETEMFYLGNKPIGGCLWRMQKAWQMCAGGCGE